MIAIRCEGISKQYRIGEQERYRALRDVIANSATAPLRALRSSLGHTNGNGNGNGNRQSGIGNHIWALEDVSFEVNAGEVVGIIGRNGAGKSTLLKILSRITKPSRGHAQINGRVGSLLEVGTGFHPELTGRENIFLNGAILGMRKAEIERKFDEIVSFAEVEKFVDTPVKRYSSGMYVRLAFAVAAHMETEVLVVDEVLAVGDAEFQKKCLGKMGDVAKDGRTVLFVSHNMGAVNALCSSALELKSGRAEPIGPTRDVVDRYLSASLMNEHDDLTRLRLSGMGRDIAFVDLELEANENGVLFGEELQFVLTIRSKIDARDLQIGSSIFAMTGACVGTLFTSDKFSIAEGETLKLRLTVSDLNLAPGSYYGGFSIGRGGKETGRHDLDIVIGAPSFEILPFSKGDAFVADWNSNWGNILFQKTKLVIERDN